MSMQAMKSETGHNPRNETEARAAVAHVASLFNPWNIDALVDGFTDDCVIRFGTVPEFRGKQKLREFFTARSKKQKNYKLTKTFRAMDGDKISNIWSGEWQDAETGVTMKGFGVEVWVMREGKCAVWEGAFNVARADAAGGVADILR